MPFDYQTLQDNFPFSTIREAQAGAMLKAEETFEQKGKRFLVLEIPVGGGKSPIAVTLGKSAGRAHITTPQIILQQQYLRDFEKIGMRELKGKTNYQCSQRLDGLDCSTVQTLFKDKPEAGTGFKCACKKCVYDLAKEAYSSSPMGITNTAYYTHASQGASTCMNQRDILIIDEAHNLEGELISFGEINIMRQTIERLGAPMLEIKKEWPIATKISKAQIWLETEVQDRLRKRRTELVKEASDARDTIQQVKLVRQAEGYENLLNKFGKFLESGSEEDWVVFNSTNYSGDPESVVIKPLYASKLAEEFLFRGHERVAMLSATILGIRAFARNLGIDIDDLGFRRFESDFPVDNRKVIFRPMGSMGMKAQEKTLPKLLKEVERLCGVYANEKGIIHTNSYKVTRFIKSHLEDAGLGDRLVTHNQDKGSRDEAVARHIKAKKPTILISPSLTEGLDLKDDLSRWQVISKTPYRSLGDEWVRARMEKEPEDYALWAALTLIQASGRSIRSATDKADTYILDSDFGGLYSRYNHLFPKWWKESVIEDHR